MRIGVIDLDTSHARDWIPILRDLGGEIAGVFDGGSIHPPSYVEGFARQHEIAQVYSSLEAMAADVDCAVIHGADWDTHIGKARPFVEAGKAVLMDKPLAGNRRDLEQLCEWSRQGARITGGSSMLVCHEVQDFHAIPATERGEAHTVLAGCGVDEFSYGIHAYALLSGILGAGVLSVRHLAQKAGSQRRIQLNWPDGRVGFVLVGEAAWLGFYTNITTEKSVTQFKVDTSRVYRVFLELVYPYLAGKTDTLPISIDQLIEPELCAIAALQSWKNGDCEIRLSEVEDQYSYDGKAYAEAARQKEYSL